MSINLNEHPHADKMPLEYLWGQLDGCGIIITRILSREDKPECGHVVLQRLDLFCESEACPREDNRIEPEDYGPQSIQVLARMKRTYFSTRCPECHDAHLKRLEARESLDVGEIGEPGEEVKI